MQIEKEETAFNFEEFKNQAIADMKAGKALIGKDGIFTPLMKEFLEAALEGEMNAHMASCLEEPENQNRRNGKMSKTVRSSMGAFELDTPRDREGSFYPQIVKKRQTVLNASLDNKILGLYGLGMSYQDIASHLKEMYDLDVSPGTISAVTDKLIPLIAEWRSRPLETVYPILFMDGMYFKSRENGKVATKVLYNILGINQEGYKEILGFYVAESEGANFWLGVLNDLKQRGVQDVLIACVDGLTGFPEAIQTVFPTTEIQLCVVHQIRNSLKYVASKNQKEFMRDLKKVYQAPSKDNAEYHLLELEEKWGEKYPMVIKSWRSNWEHLSHYFQYSGDIRRLIYTTNPIEGFHRQVRKFTKTKGAFTSETALFKLVYCACQKIVEKWTAPLQNWALTISQLDIYFEGRLQLGAMFNR
ncbi:MAG: IS256 family transposase [Alphaproteobacteria bacterium]|jgi:transposase-like protein|nr:IS256 family transposase [Alphaproteobacteria bacterium]